MKNLFLLLVVAVLFAVSVPVLGDNCPKNKRVNLPKCARVIGTRSAITVINNCSFNIDAKFDFAWARDHRAIVRAHSEYTYHTTKKLNRVSCCCVTTPQCGKCSDDNVNRTRPDPR